MSPEGQVNDLKSKKFKLSDRIKRYIKNAIRDLHEIMLGYNDSYIGPINKNAGALSSGVPTIRPTTYEYIKNKVL